MVAGGQLFAPGCLTVANYITYNQLRNFYRSGRAVFALHGRNAYHWAVHSLGGPTGGYGRVSHSEGMRL